MLSKRKELTQEQSEKENENSGYEVKEKSETTEINYKERWMGVRIKLPGEHKHYCCSRIFR